MRYLSCHTPWRRTVVVEESTWHRLMGRVCLVRPTSSTPWVLMRYGTVVLGLLSFIMVCTRTHQSFSGWNANRMSILSSWSRTSFWSSVLSGLPRGELLNEQHTRFGIGSLCHSNLRSLCSNRGAAFDCLGCLPCPIGEYSVDPVCNLALGGGGVPVGLFREVESDMVLTYPKAGITGHFVGKTPTV